MFTGAAAPLPAPQSALTAAAAANPTAAARPTSASSAHSFTHYYHPATPAATVPMATARSADSTNSALYYGPSSHAPATAAAVVTGSSSGRPDVGKPMPPVPGGDGDDPGDFRGIAGDKDAAVPLLPFRAVPQVTSVCGVKVTRRRRAALFICCGIILVLVAVFVPLLLFVIGPKIAQSSLASASLVLSSTSITAATNTSFVLSSTASVTNAGTLDATLSFGNGVMVYWVPANGSSIQLGSMPLPDISVGGSIPKSGSLSINNVTFSLSDANAMGEFSQSLVSSDSFTWRLVGTATAKALGLTFNGLSLDKEVTVGAFQGLKNVSIVKFNLPSSDTTNGITLQTTAQLENPSTITVELGTLSFDTVFQGARIGSISGSGITLTPGSNLLSLSGSIKPTDQNATSLLSTLFTAFIGGQSSPLSVVTTNVVGPNGPVSWLQKGLDGLALNVSLSANGTNKVVSNIQIPSLSVKFDPTDTTGSKVSTSATVNAGFKSPFDFPLSVKQVAQTLSFVDQASGTPFATLTVPYSDATSDQAAGNLTTSFTGGTLAMVTGQDTLYQNFFKTLTLGASASVGITGSVNAITSTAVGDVTVSNLSVTDTVSLTGFQGLSGVTIGSVTVQGGTAAAGIQLSIGTTIQNPSSITIDFGADVTLDLQMNGLTLGSVTLPTLALAPGSNTVAATALFNPQGDAAVAQGRTLLSAFLGKASSAVSVVGTSASVVYTALQPAFAGVSVATTLPGQTADLIASTTLAVSVLSVLTGQLSGSATMKLNNPFAASLSITHITASMTFKGTQIGAIDQDFAASPLTVAASATGASVGPVTVNIMINLAALQLILSSLPDGLTGSVQLNSTLVAAVGTYSTTVDYSQTVSVTFQL
ncbi:hypothetical protein HK405_008000 [Cladochytrium tenue]|nr:hypothetical protein HK405_008000 [Cladochytrium tenue]